MVQIKPKSTEYEQYANTALNLLKFKMVIMIAPAVALALIGIAIGIFASWYGLIVSAIGVIYFLVSKPILSASFKKNTQEILQIYLKHYSPLQNGATTNVVKDNRDFATRINPSIVLYAWNNASTINYVSNAMLGIGKLDFGSTSVEKLQSLLATDFGMLVVPKEEVDHYRDATIVCPDSQGVLRITFSNDDILDKAIPTKEYYYSSSKKDGNN